MEPRSAERGNNARRTRASDDQSWLQWSHAQPNVETNLLEIHGFIRPVASMEPRSAERGNRRSTSISAPWNACFNGATLSRTWKHRQITIQQYHEFVASMEPRSAERGNGLSRRRNGRRRWLQWSHAQPNVETRKPSPWRHAAGRASMEPRSAERGNARSLNRSHCRMAQASMEPRSAERGNAPLTRSLTLARSGFNGATLSRTWKPFRRRDRPKSRQAASMEPRSAERGNGL